MYGFGNRLRKLRKKRGLTQKALAAKICKSVSAVSSYESELQIPPVEVLVSIATALDVSLDYLVGFEKEASYSTKGLNAEQIAFADALFQEFRSTGSNVPPLTAKQLKLIEMLIQLLVTK